MDFGSGWRKVLRLLEKANTVPSPAAAPPRRGLGRSLPAQALFVQVDGGRREELGGLAAVFAPRTVAARMGELWA